MQSIKKLKKRKKNIIDALPLTMISDGVRNIRLWGQYLYTITLKLLFYQKMKTYDLGFVKMKVK